MIPSRFRSRRQFVQAQAAWCAAGLLPSAAWAQAPWPGKPVRLVVTFAPGGVTDSVARVLAEQLQRRLGQTVIVENKPGAAGNIGAQSVARSDPDGTSMVMVLEGTIVFNPHLFDKLSYDPMKDLVPIAKVGDSAIVLVANPTLGAKTLQEMIALSKTRPAGLSYGTAGAMTITHIAGELLKQRTGAKMTHIPYCGGGPAVTDVLGGQIPLAFVSAASVQQHVKSGALVGLAQQSPKRSSTLPDVPTFAECGVTDYQAFSWAGLFAAAKTPAAVVERWNAEINAVLADPAVQERLALIGIAATPASTTAFGAQIQREFDWYGPLLKQAGLRAENT
jgi:tripartite-type tricarboxylate transporter receptor subunit TctC